MSAAEIPSIHLSRLLREGGTVQASGSLNGPMVSGSETLELHGPLLWKATVTSMGDDEFYLSGEVSGYAILECARCLDPTQAAVHGFFQFVMRYVPGQKHLGVLEEDEEEILTFGENTIDLSELLADTFFTSLPYTVLCQEDCPGLCTDCGANLKRISREECCPPSSHKTGKLAGLEKLLLDDEPLP